ncbi:hypothetical protein psageK4_122 [Pseudomonas phage psageK4]|uniref:Uncharacterized protein n=1 Tax=Pseudomonas phage psageK4 TaxID=2859563 RepID=A0ABX8SMG3_9CAUD|nr:hypothetical protein QGX14_gp113 [Pseudomonas phage psageK4]QXV71776.1 hypothetical protein psageK4_122 [Pseudomonas phage psageK4]
MLVYIFWLMVVLDFFVPGVNIALGWYLLLLVLIALED